MYGFVRRPWDVPQRLHTSREVYRGVRPSRRELQDREVQRGRGGGGEAV